jgi:hypothetical protein
MIVYMKIRGILNIHIHSFFRNENIFYSYPEFFFQKLDNQTTPI